MGRVAATQQRAPRHAPCAMLNARAAHMRLPRMHLAPITIATWFQPESEPEPEPEPEPKPEH